MMMANLVVTTLSVVIGGTQELSSVKRRKGVAVGRFFRLLNSVSKSVTGGDDVADVVWWGIVVGEESNSRM